MTFHRGTLTEFEDWHGPIKQALSIPQPQEVGVQRTTEYSAATPHPTKNSDYIWPYLAYPIVDKAQLSMADVQALGWFPSRT